MVYDAPYLQNEFSDPQFFLRFNIILSFSNCSQNFKKICTWELLGANVLKVIRNISITHLWRGMLIHCRFTLGNKFTGTYLYTWDTAIMSEVSCPRIVPNDSSQSLNPDQPLADFECTVYWGSY